MINHLAFWVISIIADRVKRSTLGFREQIPFEDAQATLEPRGLSHKQKLPRAAALTVEGRTLCDIIRHICNVDT